MQWKLWMKYRNKVFRNGYFVSKCNGEVEGYIYNIP